MRTSSPYVVVVAALAAACAREPSPSPVAAPPGGVSRVPAVAARDGNAATGAPASSDALPVERYLQAPGARDPFHSDRRVVVAPPTLGGDDVAQARAAGVRLYRYGLDDLRVVAVVLGPDGPSAMVVDPTGRGTVLRRGMLVGRREVLASPTVDGLDVAYRWRVARIERGFVRRDAEGEIVEVPARVVFERALPSDVAMDPGERVLVMGPASDRPA